MKPGQTYVCWFLKNYQNLLTHKHQEEKRVLIQTSCKKGYESIYQKRVLDSLDGELDSNFKNQVRKMIRQLNESPESI